MRRPGMTVPELTMPALALGVLRDALVDSAGDEAAVAALRSAGHATGDAFFALLAPESRGSPDAPLSDLPERAFWQRLADLFASRGWGRLAHADVHPGVGALEAADWAEAEASNGAARPSCVFTTGLLANLLGRVAGADVAVMEVECRSRGDLSCRFLFGSERALRDLHTSLAAGASPEHALQQLD